MTAFSRTPQLTFTLRTKTVLIFSAGLLAIILSCLFITRYFFLISLDDLEHSQIEKDSNQAFAVIEDIESDQLELSFDWAIWDETYILLRYGDHNFAKRNLSEEGLDALQLDIIAYLKPDLRLVEAGYRNMDNSTFHQVLKTMLEADGVQAFLQQSKTVADDDLSALSGIVRHYDELWVMTLTPVRDSEGKEKSNGWQIWAQHISTRFPDNYQGLLTADNQIVMSDEAPYHGIIGEDSEPLHIHKSEKTLSAMRPLVDVSGQTVAYLNTTVPRLYYLKGNRLFATLIFLFAVVSGVIAVLMTWLFRSHVSDRFFHLEAEISQLFGDSKIPQAKAKDEFERISDMVEQLARASSVAEDKLAETIQKFDALYHSHNLGMLLVVDQIIVDSNPTMEHMLGYVKHELQALDLCRLYEQCDSQGGFNDMLDKALSKGKSRFETSMQRKDGLIIPVHVEVASVEQKGQLALMLSIKDLSEQKQQAELIETLTNRDPVSGLLNRPSLIRAFKQRLMDQQQATAGLYFTFTRLKEIADLQGHELYDDIIISISAELNRRYPNAEIGRISEYEFFVLDESQHLNERKTELVHKYADLAVVSNIEMDLGLRAAFIATQYLQDGFDSVLQVVQFATQQETGKWNTPLCIVDDRTIEEANAAYMLVRDMPAAIRNGEIYAQYQPIVDSQTGKITGFEALARWAHPSLGFVSPVSFIPLAERHNLIVELGESILDQAGQFIEKISRQMPHDEFPVTIHVNLSSPHFYHTSLEGYLQQLLARYRIKRDQLTLEITESMLIGAESEIIERMENIKQLGVQLALDDFGTGYSSFSTLCNFPLDIVKLDKSYVSPLEHNAKAQVLVKSIASMSRELGLVTVAEGVETASQHRKLKLWGIDEIQGYYFYKPMDESDIITMLMDR
ncbi:bifunctional diguanylate cyclase/phosphodiesterase [Vibrio sp.]|uniref:bifunctional diguanylate cyclase/phosphodiesterase n=1 Tax=Vibrio sp. TaxID=678 RepID=UPI003D0BC037